MLNNKRAQNAIEMILLAVAVLLVFIAFLHPNGPYRTATEHVLFNSATQQLQGLSNQIQLH